MVPATERAETSPTRLEMKSARRQLMLRDGLLFLSLTVVTLFMAGVTTLLFRSFESHRETLARDAASRGRAALQHGRAAEAVEDFRSALEYRRGDRDVQLALARALAASGRADQAESYFLNLWQAQPGDGSINLELARLKRQQEKPLDTIQYYRAAVFGTWAGDAPKRRRDIRLELSEYLISIGQPKAARAELLIVSGNNPDAATQLKIAELLEEAGDANDALSDYRNAAADPKTGVQAQLNIAELCFGMGDYVCAERAATKWMEHAGNDAEARHRMTTIAHDSARLQELSVSPALPAVQRARHLLADSRIAQTRLAECLATRPSPELSSLQAEWKMLDTTKNRNALRHDDVVSEHYTTALFATEHAVTAACGAAEEDDALLLYLEAHPAIVVERQP